MRLLHWFPALLAASTIFLLSHQSDLPGDGLGPDYVLHFIAYLTLGLTVVWGLTSGFRRIYSRSTAVWGWLVTSGYGIFDELHQSFVPGRDSSLRDWIADTAGAAVAVLAVFLLLRLVKRRIP